MARHVLRHGTRPSDFSHPTSLRRLRMRFDFINHHQRILKSDGAQRMIKLRAQSVAEFYALAMGALTELELPVSIDLPAERDQ